jgi:hypothetical protein
MNTQTHTSITEYYSKLYLLKQNRVEEVKDFIDFLLSKQEAEHKKHKPVFGCGKGTFEMMPNFDETLDDLKDYM